MAPIAKNKRSLEIVDDQQTKLKLIRKNAFGADAVIDPVAADLEALMDAEAETQLDPLQTVGDDNVDRDGTSATTGGDNETDSEIAKKGLCLADMIIGVNGKDADWHALKPKLDINWDNMCIKTAEDMANNLQKQVDSLKLDHHQSMPALPPKASLTVLDDANTAVGDLTASEIKDLNEIREMAKTKGGFAARAPVMQKMMRDPKIAAQMQGMDRIEAKEFRKRWADDLKDKLVMDLGLVG